MFELIEDNKKIITNCLSALKNAGISQISLVTEIDKKP